MKLIKDSNFKEIYRDENGILFSLNHIDYSSFSKNAKAIVYTNGSQLHHFNSQGQTISLGKFAFKNLATGQVRSNNKRISYGTLSSVLGDNGAYGHDCDWYDENHIPYFFKYIVDKDSDGVTEFSRSLKKTLLKLKREIVIVGKSYGGVIASYAHDYPDVTKIIAVNPSFSGSPLSNPDIMKKIRPYLPYLLAMIGANIIIEPRRKFTWENALGVKIPKTNKLKVYGGSITGIKPSNNIERVMKMGAKSIHYLSGKESDGMAIWDEDLYLNNAVDVTKMDRPFHSNSQEPDYMKKIYCKALK